MVLSRGCWPPPPPGSLQVTSATLSQFVLEPVLKCIFVTFLSLLHHFLQAKDKSYVELMPPVMLYFYYVKLLLCFI